VVSGRPSTIQNAEQRLQPTTAYIPGSRHGGC
jgi:hypothetical protein